MTLNSKFVNKANNKSRRSIGKEKPKDYGLNKIIYDLFPKSKHKRQNTQDGDHYSINMRETRNPIFKPRINSYFHNYPNSINKRLNTKIMEYTSGINVKRKQTKASKLFNKTTNLSAVLRSNKMFGPMPK